ncbi:MAG TPA: cupin domain-containing protein [Candidatus Dormibacteraeota bacterium]|nr:cupin domain-containing protein [Candidatus Dormibacteraeota bacterium]
MATESDIENGATVSDPDRQSAVWFLGGLLLVRAAGAHTGGQLAVIEHVARRGYGAPLHVHAADDETFLVMEGTLRIVCDGVEHVLEPGALAVLPKGSQHAFVVTSDGARFLTLNQPAGFDDFVGEVGVPAPQRVLPAPLEGPPAPEALETLAAAARRHGITIIGPPPGP